MAVESYARHDSTLTLEAVAENGTVEYGSAEATIEVARIALVAELIELVRLYVQSAVPLSTPPEMLKLSARTALPFALTQALAALCFVKAMGPVPAASLIVFALISDN